MLLVGLEAVRELSVDDRCHDLRQGPRRHHHHGQPRGTVGGGGGVTLQCKGRWVVFLYAQVCDT